MWVGLIGIAKTNLPAAAKHRKNWDGLTVTCIHARIQVFLPGGGGGVGPGSTAGKTTLTSFFVLILYSP